MKNLPLILYFMLLVYAANAQSVQLFFNQQDTIYVDPGSTFTIQMRVQDFNAVGTLQFTLRWDETHISLVSSQLGDLSGIFVNSDPGQLLAVWSDAAGLGQTLADSSSILNLTFTAASNWPDTTAVTFGTAPLPLELNQFDGSTLVPMDEIVTPCVIIIRQCQTSVLLPQDSICHTDPLLVLDPACQQCVSLIWNDTINSPVFVAQDGWVRVEAKGPWDCAARDSVFIAPVPRLSLELKDYNGFPISCYDAADARITALSAATTFLWSTGSTQSTVENLPVGSYAVTVTNFYGCTTTTDTLLQPPAPIAVQFQAQSPECFNETDGYIQIELSGGVTPYLLNGTLLPDDSTIIDSLSAGDYPLQIEDKNGCQLDTMVMLDSPTPYQPMATLIQRPCYNETNGIIQLNGLPASLTSLSLNGNTILNQNLISMAGAGLNQFIAVDSLGCTYGWTILVPAVPQQLISIGPDREVTKDIPLEIVASAVGGSQLADLDLAWFATTILSCTDCTSVHLMPIEDTQIILSATTIEGCLSYDTLLLSVSDQKLYFPNAFAPNTTDNALFLISAPAHQQIIISVLEIFDRWGNLVFSKRDFSPNDQSSAWDGTWRAGDCPAGVYIWQAKISNASLFGDVTLWR